PPQRPLGQTDHLQTLLHVAHSRGHRPGEAERRETQKCDGEVPGVFPDQTVPQESGRIRAVGRQA
ncbi:hypothetical protein chiPu_0034037, partial [Chiloscyllium punctatum]|nr:hypothetical protein [Chiloscyllium punctatum]